MKQIIATDRVPIKLWLTDIEAGALAHPPGFYLRRTQ